MKLCPIAGTSLKWMVMQRSLYFHLSTVSLMSSNPSMLIHTIDVQVFLNPASVHSLVMSIYAYHVFKPSEEYQLLLLQPLHISHPLLLHPSQHDKSPTLY